MQRFFVSFPLSIDVKLTDMDLIHQFTRVLRLAPGEHVILFDGDMSETEYEIVSIEKKSISLKGVARTFPQREPQKCITLYQALPNKIEKIEYILQKGVEVGIRKFVFFRSDRSQKLVISDSKIARFHSIAREAVEQSGGLTMPEIELLEKGKVLSFLACPGIQIPETTGSLHSHGGQSIQKNTNINIVLDTIGNQRSLREFSDIQNVGIWVGPEGGWSEEERGEMQSNGFIFAHFSERVMRTETAGVVVSFALINQ